MPNLEGGRKGRREGRRKKEKEEGKQLGRLEGIITHECSIQRFRACCIDIRIDPFLHV